jgi:hypothetical protein
LMRIYSVYVITWYSPFMPSAPRTKSEVCIEARS